MKKLPIEIIQVILENCTVSFNMKFRHLGGKAMKVVDEEFLIRLMKSHYGYVSNEPMKDLRWYLCKQTFNTGYVVDNIGNLNIFAKNETSDLWVMNPRGYPLGRIYKTTGEDFITIRNPKSHMLIVKKEQKFQVFNENYKLTNEIDITLGDEVVMIGNDPLKFVDGHWMWLSKLENGNYISYRSKTVNLFSPSFKCLVTCNAEISLTMRKNKLLLIERQQKKIVCVDDNLDITTVIHNMPSEGFIVSHNYVIVSIKTSMMFYSIEQNFKCVADIPICKRIENNIVRYEMFWYTDEEKFETVPDAIIEVRDGVFLVGWKNGDLIQVDMSKKNRFSDYEFKKIHHFNCQIIDIRAFSYGRVIIHLYDEPQDKHFSQIINIKQ